MTTEQMTLTAEDLEALADGSKSLAQTQGLEFNDLENLAAVGSELFDQGRIDDAQVIFEGLLATEDGYYGGHAGLGAIALENGNFGESIDHLSRAVELNPDLPVLRANLGEALLRGERIEAAVEQFEAVLAADPEASNPDLSRARVVLYEVGRMLEEGQE